MGKEWLLNLKCEKSNQFKKFHQKQEKSNINYRIITTKHQTQATVQEQVINKKKTSGLNTKHMQLWKQANILKKWQQLQN